MCAAPAAGSLAGPAAPPAPGRIGVWSADLALAPLAQLRPLVETVEELGFGALWLPETPSGRESLSLAGLLLGWSERLVLATGIASIWARDGVAAANGARTLCEAHPGRFLLGLGVSHAPSVALRGGGYGKPLSAMRAYLDAMDATAFAPGAFAPPRVLAALAPRMLELARDRALGTHTYFVPPAHTRVARAAVGPDRLVLAEQAVVLERDPSAARAIAREHMAFYLGRENYRGNLLRLGFEESDLDGGGSDRLVDAIVAWGGVDEAKARVDEHLAAGADHVCIQLLRPSGVSPLPGLRELAPALLG